MTIERTDRAARAADTGAARGQRGVAIAMMMAVAVFGAAIEVGAGTTQRCGGGGGHKTLTLTCGPGELIIGLSGKGGSYLEDIGILCGTYDPATQRYKVSGSWKIGPKRVMHDGSGICNNGMAVVSLSTNSGLFVDKLTQGYCANCHPSHGRCFDINGSFTVNTGGSGGSRCDTRCPKGEGLYRIVIRYGLWIDSVQGYCRKP